MMTSFFDNFSEYNLDVFDRGVRLPEIKISNEQKSELALPLDSNNERYLKALTWKKCQEKINSGKIKQSKEECIDRLKIEFDVFQKTGTIDYLLLLHDIFCWCDDEKNNIIRGPGRGSACGSLALYAIGLTDVNPLDHNLNFTRFLSEARAKPKFIDGIMYADGKSMADFDGDISYLRRGEVIERIEKDYSGKTCKISTLQYLTGKMAIKEAVKIYLEYSEDEALAISGLIDTKFGKVQSLNEAYHGVKNKDGGIETPPNPEFVNWVNENRETYDIAVGIEGLFRTTGVHASGILISYHPIRDIIPVELSHSDANNKELSIVSGYDMNDCLTVCVKADLLGLRTMDIIDVCCRMVGIKYKNIDINSKEIYDYYQITDNFYGLFQISDGLTKNVIKKVKPKNIDQLAACLSISRPGALKFIDDYVKFVQTGEWTRRFKELDEILYQTGGLILYQEQINNICQRIYKMSAEDADAVRRVIGKKLRDEIKKWEPIIKAKGKENGVPEKITQWFWETCNSSADYLFNMSHCYSYSYITAYTTYLKYHYLKEFYLACLTLSHAETKPLEQICLIQSEMNRNGIKLLPPDLSKFNTDFIIDGNNIRYGISSLKNIQTKTLEKLKHFVKQYSNKFELFACSLESKINVTVMGALIKSGCLDSYVLKTRSYLLLEYASYKLLKDKERLLVHKLGDKFNYDLIQIIKYISENIDENGKKYMSESRFATFKKDYADHKQVYLENSKKEDLTNYLYEKEILGFSYSNRLKNIFKENCPDLISIYEIQNCNEKDSGKTVAFVKKSEIKTSKKKKKYLYLIIEDESGEMICQFHANRTDIINEIKDENDGNLPKEGDLIYIKYSKGSDIIFGRYCKILDYTVYSGVSQYKKYLSRNKEDS